MTCEAAVLGGDLDGEKGGRGEGKIGKTKIPL